ncbi:palb protein [Ophiostoma piceae UAMH 11346]|uniref:Palb protein n=1 Tax=Ophiostoma piceae (strain UAMH 11346) TaxID=1262450 RepID=S3C658_OPHP1|nr:palb protein [Ophiostoma piceae UAMH 11346]
MEAKAREQAALASQTSGKAALQHVIAAVELYMKAVQEAQTPADRNRLRKKCTELMAYGEKLKTSKELPPVATTETSLASLSLAEPSSSPAVKTANTPNTPNATKIAKVAKAPNAAPARPVPLSTRELSKKEQIILLKASKLHGSVFPPWDPKLTDSIFTLASSNNALYEDDTVFSMSPEQSDVFTEWKRPRELFAAESTNDSSFMVAGEEPDLVQDITTDCSVVASLCAMTKFTSHVHGQSQQVQSSLLSTIMSPYDHANNTPLVSENGRYVFRMHFNGTFRKVVVDDRLPASSSRTLFVVDQRNPCLIWPALLEKAYLKVHGGYDFPGSNSGTDLWVLTGWIPEQVFIQSSSSGSSDLDLDRVWTRIQRAFDRGDVMVTLGTGRLSAEEESLLGLAGEHDYAVLDLQVDSSTGVRRMLVKNPWCDNLVWRGNGLSAEPAANPSLSSLTTTGTFWIGFEDVIQYYESLYLNWNPALFDHRQDHHFSWTLPSKAMAHSLASNPQYSMTPDADGNVWILLNRHFQDAELEIVRRKRRSASAFQSRRDSSWSQSGSSSTTSSVGYISIYVFLADGKRVQLTDRPRWTHRSPLVDSPQTLVCFEATKGAAYTVVVAQSGLPLPAYSFTLSFFSSPASLQIAPAGDLLPHQCELSDGWSRATAGGSAASPDFVRNPQYALVVPRPTPLTLLLCAEADDVPVRVDLVWARGQRVPSLAVRDLVVSSGEYQRGCALAAVVPRGIFNSSAATLSGSVSTGNGSGSAGFGSGLVEAGTYTVVLSTFERGQHSKYTLRIGSAVPVELQAIPAEDAGKLRSSAAPLMLRGGEDGSEEAEVRYEALVEARLNTRVSLIVQAVEQRGGPTSSGYSATATAAAAAAASTTAVRVSVERHYKHGGGSIYNYNNRGEVIASTGRSDTLLSDEEGEFLDMTVAGLRTKEVVLGRAPVYQQQQQNLYQGQVAQPPESPQFRIVVEMRNGRRAPNVGIQVDVLSSDRIAIHPWEEV